MLRGFAKEIEANAAIAGLLASEHPDLCLREWTRSAIEQDADSVGQRMARESKRNEPSATAAPAASTCACCSPPSTWARPVPSRPVRRTAPRPRALPPSGHVPITIRREDHRLVLEVSPNAAGASKNTAGEGKKAVTFDAPPASAGFVGILISGGGFVGIGGVRVHPLPRYRLGFAGSGRLERAQL